jgi:hypothetical protein
MKKHVFYFGDHRCQAQYKTIGHGYEVSLSFGKETIFVGNFIHLREATKWWAVMKKEITTFAHRYEVSEDVSFTWYRKFFSHSLYKSYYSFLDNEFKGYRREFDRAFAKDTKKYSSIKKHFHGEMIEFKKAI